MDGRSLSPYPRSIQTASVFGSRACERSVSGRFAAQRSSLFLWHPLHAPLSLKHHLECPLTAPLPLTPFSARCPPFPLRSALTCAALTHASAKRCQLWRLKPSLSKAATSTFSLFIYLFICSETTIAVTNCAGGLHKMPRPLQVDLWPFNLESGVRVTCHVGYIYTNFFFLGLFVLDLEPTYATDRQSDKQMSDAHLRLMPLP